MPVLSLRLAFVVLCLGAALAPARAQCVNWDEAFAGSTIAELVSSSSPAYARCSAVFDDGAGPKLYIGGDFEIPGPAGPERVAVARWNGAAWEPIGCPARQGAPETMVVFDDGNGPALYIAGNLRLLPYGPQSVLRYRRQTWEQVGDDFNLPVLKLAVHNGGVQPELYAGGAFSRIGEKSIRGVARWTGAAWADLANSGPRPVSLSSAAYDALNRRVMICGQFHWSEEGYYWLYDGTRWEPRRLRPTNPPDIRGPLVYDSVAQRMLMFVRDVIPGTESVFVWDVEGWTRLPEPATAPSQGGAMVFDPVRNRVVRFGGLDDERHLLVNWHWEFDGTDWARRDLGAAAPPARRGQGMAYDTHRNRVVMLGGEGHGEHLNDTWEFDGTTWTQVHPRASPPRQAFQMVYDQARRRMVALGTGWPSGPPGETWEYDGATWARTAPADEASGRPSLLTYDSQRARAIRIADDGNTWEYDGSGWTVAAGGPAPGEVWDIVSHDDGNGPGLFVLGGFLRLNGVSARGVAVWRDGRWGSGPSFTQDHYIDGLAVFPPAPSPSARLYAHGLFHAAPGSPSLMRWDGAAWASVAGFGAHLLSSAVRELDAGPLLYLSSNDRLFGFDGTRIVEEVPVAGIKWVHGTAAGPGVLVGGRSLVADGVPFGPLAKWAAPCSPPRFALEPADTVALAASPITFSVATRGTQPVTYRWRRNGVPLVESERVSGTTTATLTVRMWTLDDAGTYDCVATNPIGSTVSRGAQAIVPFGGGVTGVPAQSVVLTEGDPVPGVPAGTTFRDFASPVPLAPEDVVFQARTDGGGSGLWRWRAGALEALVLVGDQVPGLPDGTLFASAGTTSTAFPLIDLSVSASGRLTFRAALAGPGVTAENNAALFEWTEQGGPVVLARTGDPAPGVPGAVFASLVTRSAWTAAPGTTFTATLAGPGVTTASDGSAWLWTPSGGLRLLMREGETIRGPDARVASFLTPIQLSDTGAIALRAALTSRVVDPDTADRALLSGRPGDLRLVARSGDPAPGFGAGARLAGIDTVLLSENRDVYFGASVATTAGAETSALYRHAGGVLAPLWRGGETPPGLSGERFAPFATTFSPYRVDEDGRLLFVGDLERGGCVLQRCSSGGLWRLGPDGTELVAATWVPRPSWLPAGEDVGSVSGGAMASDGVVLFRAGNTRTATSWALGWSRAAGLFPVAVPGAQVRFPSGQVRTLRTARLTAYNSGAPTLASYARAVAPSGLLAYTAAFTDGTDALMVGRLLDYAAALDPCGVLHAPLRDADAVRGEPVALRASVSGAGLGFRWLKDGEPVADDARVTGAVTDTLRIAAATDSDAGGYSLEISHSCAPAPLVAGPAALTVRCGVDLDRDGASGVPDIFAFLVAWFEGSPGADFDRSGAADIRDLFSFLAAWFAGC